MIRVAKLSTSIFAAIMCVVALPSMPLGTADGVFSEAQAARGKVAYLANCSIGCHTPAMTGGARAPALAGDAFLQRWHGLTVDALFQRIKLTMPQTRPQSLSDQAYIDIVAFVLDANGLPSGTSDLKPTPDALRAIAINEPN